MPYKYKIVDNFNNEVKEEIKSLRASVDLALAFSSQYNNIYPKIKKVDTDLKKIEELDTGFLINPIITEKISIYDKKLEKDAGIAFIFPIIAIFILLMLSSSSVIYDKKMNFITRVKSSTSPMTYLLAKVIFFFLLTISQFLIIILLFMIYESTYIFNFLDIINLLLFVAVINSLIGILIGLIAENEGITILFSLIISFPLMLLSGIFFPVETMPTILGFLSRLLPLYYQIMATKEVLLFGLNISYVWLYPAISIFVINYILIKKAL